MQSFREISAPSQCQWGVSTLWRESPDCRFIIFLTQVYGSVGICSKPLFLYHGKKAYDWKFKQNNTHDKLTTHILCCLDVLFYLI